MKVLRLTGEQTASLLAQPESGMGFQVVEVPRYYVREPEPWLVFNAELALAFEFPSEVAGGWSEIRNAGSIEWLRGQAVDPGQVYQEPRVVVTRSGVGMRTTSYGPAGRLASAPLSLIKQSITSDATQYYRFSAFPNDRRVDPRTGSFAPGTYATTGTDQPMAPSGFAAVGRYALPNVTPSSYLHALVSPSGVVVHSGTVAPAYGQSGGGVEVFFPSGVRNAAAYLSPRRLPDE